MKNKKRNVIITWACVGFCLLVVIIVHLYQKNRLKSSIYDNSIIIIHDRHNAVSETIYVFNSNDAFCQNANFPGYDNRILKSLKIGPEVHWALIGLRGDIYPPFQPPGPPYCVEIFPSHGYSKYVRFFQNDNPDIVNLCKELEDGVLDMRLDHVPPWADELKSRLGF